ncbi:MAG: Holliday junction resolvase RuvX [Verrucomicrobiota bacterium]|nr:Holliday junction resolvase RuvX [Limisphaera sp.]MDW8382026.1 Holliday junction resolvase RuvX [Verrucomicrobiota bacterium]
MRILALDYGTRRVGVAISDELGMLARPLGFLTAEPFERFVEDLRRLVEAHGVGQIVVGMPRNMNGSYGAAAETVRAWMNRLEQVLSIPLVAWDERLTTVQAQRMLHEAGLPGRKQRIRLDSSAATILLQSYLDRAS